MQGKTFTLASRTAAVFVHRWAPDAGVKPKALVQIAHGAAEHGGRYERFGRVLADAGYLVYADDHRGHGKTCGGLEGRGIAGPDAWNGMLRDQQQLSTLMRRENPGLPLIFFGHSMGSLIAQHYIQTWGGELKGAILSGSFGTLGVEPAVMVATLDEAIRAQGPTRRRRSSRACSAASTRASSTRPVSNGSRATQPKSASTSTTTTAASRSATRSCAICSPVPARSGKRGQRAAHPRRSCRCWWRRATRTRPAADGRRPAAGGSLPRLRPAQRDAEDLPGRAPRDPHETNRDEVHRDIVAWLNAP